MAAGAVVGGGRGGGGEQKRRAAGACLAEIAEADPRSARAGRGGAALGPVRATINAC